jgi:hypothetical protein
MEDTAPHDAIPLCEPQVVERLLMQGRIANALGAAMLIAAIVIAALLLSEAWPPRATQEQHLHGSAPTQIDRAGQALARRVVEDHGRSPGEHSEHE